MRRLASRRTAAELAEAEATIAELEPLRLRDGEEDDLGAERLRLRHATGIARAATLLGEAATGDEAGAADVLEHALAEVDALSGVDAGLADLGGEAAALTAALRDLGVSARRLADRVEVDPARLEAVEERLDTLARVRRRHGSIRAALSALEGARRICDAARGGHDLVALEVEARAAQVAAAAAAGRLSAARREAARSLERAVERHLAVLELPDARFRVTLGVTADADGVDLGDGPVRCDADGVDQVEMRLAANRGGVPLPLDEGPSGGELSRLALALAAAGGGAGQPLLVLDEVDTGVGGETAARVGDLLAEIGRGRQVLAVTHRPEIAARAGWHLLVSRTGRGAAVESGVRRVEGEERVAEVARMMSGRTTAAALARAGGAAPGGRGDREPPSERRLTVGARGSAGSRRPRPGRGHGYLVPWAAMSESATVVGRGGSPRRFPVEVGEFSGSLEELVLAAQRGDLDLRELPVAEVTTQVSRQLTGTDLGGDLRDAAEALGLLARLLSLKAARVTEVDVEPEEEVPPETDAGRRLAEYRLFRAAMEALLLEPAETGERSFLGLVAPEVLPLERLRIPPDRLAAAFRQVLERLQDAGPLPVGMVTFSVEEKVTWLQGTARPRAAGVRGDLRRGVDPVGGRGLLPGPARADQARPGGGGPARDLRSDLGASE